MPSASIIRRLTINVLLLELAAALVLIATVGNHERHIQFTIFQANLRATANALFGAVQEAEFRDGSIVLDAQNLSLPGNAVYSVTDASGFVLGKRGQPPVLDGGSGGYVEASVGGEAYLFYALNGDRVIDPGSSAAVVHHVRVTYGLPTARVWSEVFEAIRFFALATVVLLGSTALLLSWLLRRLLQPIRHLAAEADLINTERWVFNPPASSKRLVELRPLASAIEKLVSRLQRSFEQQRRFTSDAAHELKTDLAIVKSSLQLLTMKRRTVDEYESGLSLGLGDIGRMENTVQEMLTLARLEQTPADRRQACDFADAVVEAVTQSQPLAEARQVRVARQIPGDRAFVLMSKEDAVLLCSNVLVNALQHSPSEGVVDVSLTQNHTSVLLLVRDRGAGIHDEDQPFLFDPFYRGDASRSRKTGGTGLGLSICKAICVRAGGTITIANHSQGGAVVEVRLPVKSDAPSQ